MIIRLLAMAAAMATSVPALAQRAGPNTNERVRMNGHAARTMALGDLESMLVPEGEFLTGSHVIANEGYLYTLPMASGFPGLCKRQQIVISYQALDEPGVALRNRRLQPYDLRIYTLFKIIRDKVTIDDKDHGGPYDGNCPDIDPGIDDSWINSESAETAAMGYNALTAALERIKDGTLAISRCNQSEAVSYCATYPADLAKPGSIFSISKCEADRGHLCFEIFGSAEVTIHLRDTRSPEPADIERIDAAMPIVVS